MDWTDRHEWKDGIWMVMIDERMDKWMGKQMDLRMDGCK